MLNICGCLVHTMPDMTERVIAAINATGGGLCLNRRIRAPGPQ